jgi:D-amino peptidase
VSVSVNLERLSDIVTAVFIGSHAMARTPRTVHAHTIAGAVIAAPRLNGRPHGETGLNAAVPRALGIPVVLVPGDTATCVEARTFLGDQVEAVTVEEACGRNAAICRAPAAIRAEITAAAARARPKADEIALYQPERPALGGRLPHCAVVRPRPAGRWRRASPVTISTPGDEP